MIQPFLQYIRTFAEIDDARAKKISNIFQLDTRKKNSILIEEGQICDKVFFVLRGAMRTYTTDEDGNEYTRIIAIENNFISNLSSFKDQTKSEETITTIEETTFLYTERKDIYALLSKDVILKDIYTEIVERFNISNINKINRVLTLTSKRKVQYFYKYHKDFVKRFPDRINASYLNMTRESYNKHKKSCCNKNL